MTESTVHEDRFFDLLERDGTAETDIERRALFYIFAHEQIYSKVNSLYDFEDHSIKIEGLESSDFSHGVHMMIELAFNLYNGFECESPVDIFSRLDKKSFEICLMAIRFRFNIFNF